MLLGWSAGKDETIGTVSGHSMGRAGSAATPVPIPTRDHGKTPSCSVASSVSSVYGIDCFGGNPVLSFQWTVGVSHCLLVSL